MGEKLNVGGPTQYEAVNEKTPQKVSHFLACPSECRHLTQMKAPEVSLATWNYGNELYSSIDRRLFPSSEKDGEKTKRRQDRKRREVVSCFI